MGFLIRYVVVAAALLALVWFGIPKLKQSMGSVSRIEVRLPSVVVVHDYAGEQQQVREILQEQKSVRFAFKKPAVTETTESTNDTAPAVDTATSVPAVEQHPRPALAKADEECSWGITCAPFPYYTTDGVAAGMLSGGVLINCLEYVTINNVLCIRATSAESDNETQLLFPQRAVLLMTSRPEGLDAEALTALKGYYKYEAEIEKYVREQQMKSNSNGDANPYKKEYVAAYQAYEASIKEAKRITEARDKADMGDRVKAEDLLRTLRHEQAVLQRRVQDVQPKYREWKNAHPEAYSGAAFDPNKDPQVVSLRAEQKRLAPLLQGLIP